MVLHRPVEPARLIGSYRAEEGLCEIAPRYQRNQVSFNAPKATLRTKVPTASKKPLKIFAQAVRMCGVHVPLVLNASDSALLIECLQ